MKKNKLFAAILSLALVSALALPARAANTQSEQPNRGAPVGGSSMSESADYTIEINGKSTEIQPMIMVPLRAIAEQLGFQVTWNNGSVLADNGITHTVVTIGQDLYCVTTSIEGLVGMSAPFSLGAVPYVSNGVTYVPLELFRVLLGNGKDAITVDGGKIRIAAAAGNVQIANSFVTCATLEEAAKLAGFGFTVPAELKENATCSIQAVKNQMIQAIYTKADDETLRLRKAVGTEDISGDYTAYAETNTIPVGALKVTTKGENGRISVAIWTDGDYTYSIGAQAKPMSASEVSELVAGIH